ncbi:hypothetical protein [Lacipirellula parvula]|uniref:Uncharacterized protein n=1 Tax=Lacipirellula parvula TaxID=2650471 RepID=A0A5K7XE28_9BACT|nr:hypothetical protein [Lacipirellula parvula]BBO34738.1 hypothetical protein PLANPX_4350 [Lacipirellula parvula]
MKQVLEPAITEFAAYRLLSPVDGRTGNSMIHSMAQANEAMTV